MDRQQEEQQPISTSQDIDNYPSKDPQYVFLHQQQQAAIIRISSEYFTMDEFDYGSKEQKKQMGINKKIKKYYIKRFFLFEEFDNGIQMDEESWYSVVAEPISLNIKERLLLSKIPLNTIFEPFSGVGGVAVHLSCLAKRYVLNDLDPNKLEMLKNNMAVYGVDQSNVEFLNKDFLVIEPFKADLVILCPPWGGINLDQYSHKDLDLIMKPKLSDILTHACKFSRNIILQMPKNTNIVNLLTVISKTYGAPAVQIAKITFNGYVSQLFIYMGDQHFTRLMYSTVYQLLYDTFGCETKQQRENVKKNYKSDPAKVLREAYHCQQIRDATYDTKKKHKLH